MSGKVGDNLFRASGVVAALASDAYDDDQIQSNIAMLGFKVAVNGSLTRYNLVDQSIDEYFDTSGVDASASTNEARSGVSPYYYFGGAVTTPTVTQDADSTGTDGLYSWYKWTDTASTGSYENDTTQDHEYLIVGGGASGGKNDGGGGGAGGLLTSTGLSLTGGNEYTVTIAAGGAAVSSSGTDGNDGGDSILSGTGISTLTAGGGGGGGKSGTVATVGRATNGNGGGGGYNSNGAAGNGAGYAGGSQSTNGPAHGAGGGGGAAEVGEAGTDSKGGDGGDGVANDIIETGTNVYYAGGGGSFAHNTAVGAGGNGGGGAGGAGPNPSSTAGTAGTANTGGGGGGAHEISTGAGGSGIVIIRRLTSGGSVTSDLTLQSIDTTAMTEPDYADMVMLMENSSGTATLNTDIKGYISEDSGVTFTQGTLVDEGTWGTNKKILAFHDLDISAQSGTSMCYKITTHNQSAGSKETKIHATSIGWKA